MAKKKTPAFSAELLDELLKDQDPATVLQSDGLLGELKKALAERMLNAELDAHLESAAEQAAGNHRNGYSRKTVRSGDGELILSIPRDRHGRFDPALIPEYQRQFPGFDQKIIALCARGMSMQEIQAHIREPYDTGLSPGLISKTKISTGSTMIPESDSAAGSTMFALANSRYLRSIVWADDASGRSPASFTMTLS